MSLESALVTAWNWEKKKYNNIYENVYITNSN